MRWFASLVVLCLLAGTGARPRVEVRETDHAQHLASADGLVAIVARRGSSVAPDLQLPPFVVTPVAVAIAPPTRTALPSSCGSVERRTIGTPRIHSARGPPDGRRSVDFTRS